MIPGSNLAGGLGADLERWRAGSSLSETAKLYKLFQGHPRPLPYSVKTVRSSLNTGNGPKDTLVIKQLPF